MSWIIFLWLTVSAPPCPHEVVPSEPCRLKVDISALTTLCEEIDCGGVCEKYEIIFDGTTYTSCKCEAGGTYEDVCRGRAVTNGGTITLECTAVSTCQDCEHANDPLSDYIWCTCQ